VCWVLLTDPHGHTILDGSVTTASGLLVATCHRGMVLKAKTQPRTNSAICCGVSAGILVGFVEEVFDIEFQGTVLDVFPLMKKQLLNTKINYMGGIYGYTVKNIFSRDGFLCHLDYLITLISVIKEQGGV